MTMSEPTAILCVDDNGELQTTPTTTLHADDNGVPQTTQATILCVDDNEELQTAMRKTIGDEGYNVILASDGEQAMDKLQKESVHLVLLDLKLPKHDGWEVLSFVKSHFPNIKVFIFTAYGNLTNCIRAKKEGADEFLEKPCDIGEIIHIIKRYYN